MVKSFSVMLGITLSCFFFSHTVAAKGSTLVDGSGKPIKVAGGCMKVSKTGKNHFHYSACHKIKPKKS